MVGTTRPVPPARADPAGPAAPDRMAANADGMSRAAPQARPECTPAAAYRSG